MACVRSPDLAIWADTGQNATDGTTPSKPTLSSLLAPHCGLFVATPEMPVRQRRQGSAD